MEPHEYRRESANLGVETLPHVSLPFRGATAARRPPHLSNLCGHGFDGSRAAELMINLVG
jgi:hypothetical protein